MNFWGFLSQKKKYFAVFLLLSFSYVLKAQAKTDSTVEIVAVGDILLARGIEKKIEQFGPDYLFAKVKHILTGADLAFGNLENPLTNKCEKVQKKYGFQAKPQYTKILRLAGLDVLSLANNHSLDCGKKGLLETFKNLEQENLLGVGAGKSGAEAETPLIIERKGIKFAFLGFTAISPGKNQETFSNISLATAEKVGHSVKLARQKADVVIVSFHWGKEYHPGPNSEQINLAKVAVQTGADAVLGHHPHVLQEIRSIKGKNGKRPAIVAYSLGNFVFDSPVRLDKRLAESVILKMKFGKNGLLKTEVIPIKIENYRPVMADETTKKLIFSRLKFPSNFPGSFNKLLKVDLDSDGKPESINLNSERQNSLEIRHEEKLLWQGVPANWKPWKLDIADVDGDGIKEIILGVFKSTKFFPKPHNCLFIYGWNGQQAFPKWLGSSLSRAFTDFIFADLDNRKKGDELIALEKTLEGKKGLTIYNWNGFGFTANRREGDWKTAKILGIKNGSVAVEADGQQIFITTTR
jgi:poly-gamma-glutamate synthesis protein (capsule biosynthesis protein)